MLALAEASMASCLACQARAVMSCSWLASWIHRNLSSSWTCSSYAYTNTTGVDTRKHYLKQIGTEQCCGGISITRCMDLRSFAELVLGTSNRR